MGNVKRYSITYKENDNSYSVFRTLAHDEKEAIARFNRLIGAFEITSVEVEKDGIR